eukprot:CAMPEP_0170606232 /NCGR_PEP_ID=MMETSP0224-20130122/20401_1 /TAXON_ID=285029 /ORGANISM="Togula jolla, Strain CCCM 725" /LENGTH=84 /DNA_ID=CAMNT_0010931297 /DNA_START=430 /DNA_END=681 /DNA_ORIENTATION=+
MAAFRCASMSPATAAEATTAAGATTAFGAAGSAGGGGAGTGTPGASLHFGGAMARPSDSRALRRSSRTRKATAAAPPRPQAARR